MTDTQDLPADELEDLQGLLRLKNYEQPADGYHEDFLDEFHRRQRESMVSANEGSFVNRISSWFQDLGAAKWAIGAGAAYAVLALTFFGSGFFESLGEKNPAGIAKETEDFLPQGSSLQHVELETKKTDEESLEILPEKF